MRDDWLNPQLSIRLIELHADKDLSMRAIADKLNAEFGTSLTRFAIIGRSHRLKLEKRPPPPPPGNRKMIQRPIAPIAPLEEYGPPRPEGVRFSQLDLYRECHWPHGELQDKAEFFCGKPMMEGSPAWCAEHHGKVYSKGKSA